MFEISRGFASLRAIPDSKGSIGLWSLGLHAGYGFAAWTIDLMHNDVTRLDAREECWS
jgi:hypothetical protein